MQKTPGRRQRGVWAAVGQGGLQKKTGKRLPRCPEGARRGFWQGEGRLPELFSGRADFEKKEPGQTAQQPGKRPAAKAA